MKKIIELFNKYREIIMYVIVGGLTTVVSLASYYLLTFTILDAQNPLQLQIANIISWILCVSFAFVANRKYVFESKNKNIAKECLSFFLARLSTLIIDMISMGIMVSFLKMNDSIAKIIVQFIILILNYILSKFLVFNKSTNKEPSEKKKINKSVKNIKLFNNRFLVLLFLMFMLLCCFFPYTGDDWAWGTKIGIDRLNSWFDNYNGRYAGNLLILVLTRSKILRVIVETVTFTLIIKYIYKIINDKNKTNILISILLLLLMPVTILRQSVTWASGFANYVLPILLVLFIIHKNIKLLDDKQEFNEKRILKLICYFIISFVGSLFIENITLYNLFLILTILIYEKIRFKKCSIANIIYFVGSLCGSIMMFSNSAYLSIFNNNDGYRTITTDNVVISSIKTFIKTLSNYIFIDNVFVEIILSICIILLIFKYKNKHKIINGCKGLLISSSLLFTLLYLFNIVYTNLPFNDHIFSGKLKLIFNCLTGLLMLASLISTSIICIDNKYKTRKILFYIGSLIIFNLPLLMITPVGPRLFLTTYVFYILIILEILDYVYKTKINRVDNLLKITIVIAFLYLIAIYYSIYKVEMIQSNCINYFKKNSTVIYLPALPHSNYIHCANKETGVFGNRYKLFYGINQSTMIKFVDYEDWKKIVNNYN